MIIRKYKISDLREICDLFYYTVHKINAKDYSKEQLDVWATGEEVHKWGKSLSENFTLVAVNDGLVVGFGDIDKNGYLDRLYVNANFQGRGIATEICNRLERESEKNGIVKITTHASITAKPFFEKRNYVVIKNQQVERQGVKLENYIMEKIL